MSTEFGSPTELHSLGRTLAHEGIRIYTETRHLIRRKTRRIFVEEYVLADKTMQAALRRCNDRASVNKGIDEAFAEFKERREREPENKNPIGAAWYQLERRKKREDK